MEKVGDNSATFEEFKNSLPEKDVRFCVFNFEGTTKDGRNVSKLVYVFWSPDTAPGKFIYKYSKK